MDNSKYSTVLFCLFVFCCNFHHTCIHDVLLVIPETLTLWANYLDLINSSLEHYTECPDRDTDCTCHAQGIQSDLDVWTKRGGITKEEFNAARDKKYGGVFYQILDHKLYRQKDCMFGSRYQYVMCSFKFSSLFF